MNSVSVLSTNTEQTLRLGEKLAKHLRRGDILCLEGDLGSGKTTLIKGIAKGLKIAPEKVHSPTFVLMNAYEGKLSLYHFDLYRLEGVREISSIGYEEFLYGHGVAVIEWAGRLGELTPKEYLRVELKHKGENERLIKFLALGEKYCRIMKGVVNGKE
jgi:tRNA threonylcarbamoyladenosine biosynthesis protein TsaE